VTVQTMNGWLLDLLCCPRCRAERVSSLEANLASGELRCVGCQSSYQVLNGIPRFVSTSGEDDQFGFQWNRFRRTQLDSASGLPVSRERFFDQLGWKPEDLAGKLVLDVGCGAGRFAEVALAAGARLVAVDYSSAADACRENLGERSSLGILQADLHHLPLKPNSFDFVYCFGVLQHTPDVKAAFLAVVEQSKPGGCLAVDVYPKSLSNAVNPKYWLRPVTKRLPLIRLLSAVRIMVRVLLPLSVVLGRIPVAGRKLRRLVPVANYDGVYPLSRMQLREWALLDTFDMLAPRHDHPQSVSTLRSWFSEAGLERIEVFKHGVVVGRAIKPFVPGMSPVSAERMASAPRPSEPTERFRTAVEPETR
jgi:SAM-dependent methyltransferase/uncharacterized protein YbaR (Trm112 family)